MNQLSGATTPGPRAASAQCDAPPRLSIVLMTYEHERYCRMAFESILRQQVDFPYEIIVADDGSTDRTMAILQHLASGNPAVRFLPSDRRRGIAGNYRRAFGECRGEYIAVLEGNDFWTSPTKLREQARLLEERRELSMAFAEVLVWDESGGRLNVQPRLDTARVVQGVAYFSAADLALENIIGNFSACVYRRSAVEAVPEGYYSVEAYDWLFNIYCAGQGAIGCMQGVMSVCRRQGGRKSSLTKIQELSRARELAKVYDRLTGHKYRGEFKLHRKKLRKQIMALEYQELLSRSVWRRKCQRTMRKIVRAAHAYMPPLLFRFLSLMVPPAATRLMYPTASDNDVASD